MEVGHKANDVASEKAQESCQLWPKVKDFVSEMPHSLYQLWPKAKEAVIEYTPLVCFVLLVNVAPTFLLPKCIFNPVVMVMFVPTLLLIEGMDHFVAEFLSAFLSMLIPLVGVFIQFIAMLGGATWGENGVWLDFSLAVPFHLAATLILPLYFYLRRPAVNTRDRPSYSIRVILPWKLGAIRMDGCLVKSLTAEGGMRGLAAIVVFYSLIGATTTAAVMAARLQLLQISTVRHVLRIASATSLILCAPSFLLLPVGSRISNCLTIILFPVLIPAAIATVHALDAWDVCSMGELLFRTDRITRFLWGVMTIRAEYRSVMTAWAIFRR